MQKYSVLMSLYHKERPEYLRAALDSMIGQTVAPDEIVIVEDGALTEELYGVVAEYKDKFPGLFTIVVLKRNHGLGLALNAGLKKCRSELVARMDTDDISKPDRCEKQLGRFEQKPQLSIVGSHIDEFEGDITNVISSRRVPLTSREIYEYAKRRSAFNHPAVMYRRSAVLAAGGYSKFKRNQDVELFGRMLFKGYKAENIDESLLWFRHSRELSARRRSWENTWTYIAAIYSFWKMGYSSLIDLLIVAAAQTGMYLVPIGVQNWIYKRFLRK